MNAQQQPSSGMWAPYVPPEIGEKFDVLKTAGEFVLVDVTVREPVDVEIEGRKVKRTPADLRVQTIDATKTRLFSGFAAGIVAQCKRFQAGDLPAVVRIVDATTPNGKTTVLEMVKPIAAGANLAAIAGSLPVPIAPIAPSTPTDDIPY